MRSSRIVAASRIVKFLVPSRGVMVEVTGIDILEFRRVSLLEGWLGDVGIEFSLEGFAVCHQNIFFLMLVMYT